MSFELSLFKRVESSGTKVYITGGNSFGLQEGFG